MADLDLEALEELMKVLVIGFNILYSKKKKSSSKVASHSLPRRNLSQERREVALVLDLATGSVEAAAEADLGRKSIISTRNIIRGVAHQVSPHGTADPEARTAVRRRTRKRMVHRAMRTHWNCRRGKRKLFKSSSRKQVSEKAKLTSYREASRGGIER